MDIATIIGLIGGFIIVVIVMILDGGSPMELLSHPSAILLTMGGALTASMASFPLSATVKLPKYFAIAMKESKFDIAGAIELIARMADTARREGLLALEEQSKKIEDEFLRKGVMLVVDGTDPAQVRAILEIEIKQMEERHGEGIGFLASAGGYGPTLGIIGTVMGLITVLKQLDDPGALGQHIAAAFLATLWGIMSANLIWLPLSSKLRVRSEGEAKYRYLLLEGIIALQAGENPRLVREKLMAYLPPKQRAAAETAAGEVRPAGAEA